MILLLKKILEDKKKEYRLCCNFYEPFQVCMSQYSALELTALCDGLSVTSEDPLDAVHTLSNATKHIPSLVNDAVNRCTDITAGTGFRSLISGVQVFP